MRPARLNAYHEVRQLTSDQESVRIVGANGLNHVRVRQTYNLQNESRWFILLRTSREEIEPKQQ